MMGERARQLLHARDGLVQEDASREGTKEANPKSSLLGFRQLAIAS